MLYEFEFVFLYVVPAFYFSGSQRPGVFIVALAEGAQCVQVFRGFNDILAVKASEGGFVQCLHTAVVFLFCTIMLE